jgi:hypothetical protein
VWIEFQLSKKKQYRYPKTRKPSKAMGTGFDVLDAAIETFGHGIGRAMSEIRQYTAKMTLEHLSDF